MSNITVDTLPGTEFHLVDQPQVGGTPAGSGDTVLIAATALDGPLNYPVNIANIPNLAAVFGPMTYNTDYNSPDGNTAKLGTYSYNTLLRAVSEAQLGGANNIIVCRVGNATYATTNAVLGGINVTAQAFYPGNVYNGSSLKFQAGATYGPGGNTAGVTFTILTQPSCKGASAIGSPAVGLTFTYNNDTTFQSIAQQFNSDPRNTVFTLSCPASGNLATVANAGISTASGTVVTLNNAGTNGTLDPNDPVNLNHAYSKTPLYQSIIAANGTFDQLDGLQTDWILFPDIYADDDIVSTSDTNDASVIVGGAASYAQSFIQDLAQYCYNQGVNGYPCHAVIGVNPIQSTQRSVISNRVTRLNSYNATAFDNDDVSGTPYNKLVNIGQFISNGIPFTDPDFPGTPAVDTGRYVSIHAGPDIYVPSTSIGTYLANPSVFYAGLVASLPCQRGATNVGVNPIVPLAYTYTKKQRNLLNSGIGFSPMGAVGGGAFVTFTEQLANQTVSVTSDVTSASRASSFSQLQISRIIQQVNVCVEQVANLFIGQANVTSTISTLESQIVTAMNIMATQNAINGPRGQGYDFSIGTAVTDSLIGRVRITMWVRPAREIRKIITTISVTQ